MDRGHDVMEPSTQDVLPVQGCRSCQLVQSMPSRSTVDGAVLVAEAGNEDAVVLRGPHLDGLVVIPRQCIHVLEELPPRSRANVLAAVRSATLLVHQGTTRPSCRIVSMNDSSAPTGHVSFQVLPNCVDEPMISALRSSPPF
jgi:hypothetical protein